jgi:hypothetical protein
MGSKFYLTPILGLLFVLMYFGPMWLHDQNVLGSVSVNQGDGATAEQPLQQSQPIDGTSGIANEVFNTHELTLGNNIKNLVILIPNEGHHGPQADEDRFLDQPFIPQNAVLNKGTNIIWFNGDVGVVDQTQASPSPSGLSGSAQSTADTIGILMVPTQDIQTYTTDLKNRGFNIDSTHNFKDLRGGQSGTGNEQTLIVWTTSGMDLSTVASNLQEFSTGLPYS